jgi:hypothetical protein
MRSMVIGVLVLPLAACAMHPGEAAVGGGVRISQSKVDSTARLYCTAFGTATSHSQTTGLAQIRGYITGELALRGQVDGFAAANKVNPAPAANSSSQQYLTQLVGVPADQVSAVIAVEGVSAYAKAVFALVGAAMVADGTIGPSTSTADQLTAAQQAFVSYQQAHPVTLAPIDTNPGTSVALSAAAKRVDQASTLDATDAAALPARQTCG